VLLDAFGTLLDLEPPAPVLGALLAAEGHVHPPDRLAAAMATEVRYYRAHQMRGRDRAGLAALRRDCARVVAAALGPDVPPPARMTELLVASLRFRLMPDAAAALDALAARGIRLAVVSNWDCSLPDVLAGLGVAERLDAVVASAVVGAAKPDPAIFRAALAALGVEPERALHCGDRPELDGAGARAAGIPAVIVDRAGTLPPGPWPRLSGLAEIALWTGREDPRGAS
jgi:HAD superfamily hydrolase (TIGR01509 family)